MATAKDCFAENLRLIGRPSTADRAAATQWNLNQGLLLLAEQLEQVQAVQRHHEQTLQTLLQHARGQR